MLIGNRSAFGRYKVPDAVSYIISYQRGGNFVINSIVPNLDAPRLARLVEVSRELSSTNDLDSLLKLIIGEAASLTDAEAASILLLDPYTRELRFKAASGGMTPEM